MWHKGCFIVNDIAPAIERLRERLSNVIKMQDAQRTQMEITAKMMDTFIEVLQSRQHAKRDLMRLLGVNDDD